MKTSTILVACLLLSAVVKAQSSNNLPQLGLQHFASGFQYPMDIANCGDSRLFVVERLGKIWILDSAGNKSAEPFLDITNKVFTVFPFDYDERGLLGLAFHPNYPDSPYFYVNYIGHDSDSHIARFTVNPNNPDKAQKQSELMLLTVQQPKAADFVNHKGGCLKFGPDGYLYGTLGDGGSAGDPLNNAQNTRILLGKMFRIDVDHPDNVKDKNYSVPPTNPFVNVDKVKDEIWATGLRNPWRFSFDRKNGALWLPDVGQDKWEEINVEAAGSKGGNNFGWSCYEGVHNFKINGCDYNGMPYTFPIVEYKHTLDPCNSITGGFVYRGSQFKKMMGKYFYCDYCTGKFSTVFKYNATWLNIFLLQSTELVYVTFGEDVKGELYVADNVNGDIYHLVDSSDLGNKITAVPNSAQQQSNGVLNDLNAKIYPNPTHGQFSIELNASTQQQYKIIVTNMMGNEVLSETKTSVKGFNHWSFSTRLQKGFYMLHIQTDNGNIARKLVVE